MSLLTNVAKRDAQTAVSFAEVRQQWGVVKDSIDKLLEAYHSIGDGEGDRLDDICEHFELSIDFDSPLAIID